MITTTCLDSTSKEFTIDFPAAELSDYCALDGKVGRFGYVGALAAMLAVGLGLYFYLRKVKWL